MRYPQDMQKKYPRCMQNITDIYPRYAWYLLIICLGYTCNIPKITQDVYMKYNRDIWEICMGCTPDIPEISMRYTWDKHGKYLWYTCDQGVSIFYTSCQRKLGIWNFMWSCVIIVKISWAFFWSGREIKAYRACSES